MSAEKDDFTFIARERYRFYREMTLKSQDAHLQYGKWLIASLLLVNGGAIIGIARFPGDASNYMKVAGYYFVAGLLLSFAAGFLSWLNFQIASHVYYNKWANLEMVVNPEKWSPLPPYAHWVEKTLYIAALTGVASWLSTAVGAYKLISALSK